MIEFSRPLVLASGSPRRRELLAAAAIPFTVRTGAVVEAMFPAESPVAYVKRLAREKASAVEAAEDEIVLGADTVVLAEGEILEKPRGIEDAVRMLKVLSGRKHEVITGVCLKRGLIERTASAMTSVWFLPIDEGEIAAYAESGEPMDKAGAYAIQGVASRWVEKIDGCYFNVVGLPVSLVWRELRNFG